jgi:hypothetical protein
MEEGYLLDGGRVPEASCWYLGYQQIVFELTRSSVIPDTSFFLDADPVRMKRRRNTSVNSQLTISTTWEQPRVVRIK